MNQAIQEELEVLPQIGEKRAKAILAYREKVGEIKTKQDLYKIKEIPDQVIENISTLICFDKASEKTFR